MSACQRRHTGKDASRWRLGDDDLVAIVTVSGLRQIKAICPDCGLTSGAVPFEALPQPPEAYPVLRDNRFKFGHKPCQVKGCDNDYTEYHHFAPRAVFGQFGADDWPGAYLCREHHTEWHQRMDGYRWRAPAIYAESLPW